MFPLVLAVSLLADTTSAQAAGDLDAIRAAVTGSAQGAPQSSTFGSSASDSSGARFGANVSVTFYPWTPLFDDASPRSLQGFLQRTSFVELSAGAYYTTLSYSLVAQGGDYTQQYVPAAASTRYFVAPNLALLASAGFDYQHDVRSPVTALGRTRSLWEPFGSVGIDARSGDASLTLDWEVTAATEQVNGAPLAAPPGVFWPRLTFGGRVVLDHEYDLTASAGLIPDGGSVRAGLGVYPTKDLGMTVFAQYDHGQIYLDSTTDYDRVQGGPAIAYWVSPRVELSLSYTPEWIRWANGDDTTWEHQFLLGVTGRLP